jgi:hypothetical protein
MFIGHGLNEDNNSTAAASTEDLDVLLIGGMPLNESVARYDPFVINAHFYYLRFYCYFPVNSNLGYSQKQYSCTVPYFYIIQTN